MGRAYIDGAILAIYAVRAYVDELFDGTKILPFLIEAMPHLT